MKDVHLLHGTDSPVCETSFGIFINGKERHLGDLAEVESAQNERMDGIKLLSGLAGIWMLILKLEPTSCSPQQTI